MRTERDSMGEVLVPDDAYYGASTQRAVENFPISSLRFTRRMIEALGLVKRHAAEANLAQGQADAAVIAAQGAADALIIQAEAEAEARLIEAEAEAQALQLLGAALAANPDVLQLQYIEKIAPNISVMLLPGDTPFLLPLPDAEQPVESVAPAAP